ncbi:MAG: DEAD/DEAH box helicase, partial [Streptosporangiaceae bacterium]
VAYLAEQKAATGRVPDDRTLVVERFRDELGDWRLIVHSPYGALVHAPWALAIAARLRERYGMDAQAMHSDDGIVVRIPDTDEPPPADLALFEPDEIERIVVDELGSSALFAARFRECAARSLLLPRHRPDRRMPLWQQRQRSAQLLAVASKYSTFPIILETFRECLQDVFDVPGLVQLMRDLAGRRARLTEVETAEPSPYARSLLFRYIGAFMYEGDSPLAERKAQALALDSALLSELLGQADLRELLDPEVVAEAALELQRRTADRRAFDLDGTADLLRLLGPLTTQEVAARLSPRPAKAAPADTAPGEAVAGAEAVGAGVVEEALRVAGSYLVELAASRRALGVRVGGAECWAAIEDAGKLRDALGTPLPVGIPEAFLEPADDPLGELLIRYARTHAPFHPAEAASRFGLGSAVVVETLKRLPGVVEGEFTPGAAGTEWVDVGVLRMLRRRSLARLRAEVEPSSPESLARFLPQWQGVGGRHGGIEALAQAIEQLQGAAVPASALESLILPARVPGYSPALLDELTSAGEVIWAGRGGLPGGDGWLSLYLADTAPLLMPEHAGITMTPAHQSILDALADGAALFFRTLADRMPPGTRVADQELVDALWDLVWAGHLTNDTLAPLRSV